MKYLDIIPNLPSDKRNGYISNLVEGKINEV